MNRTHFVKRSTRGASHINKHKHFQRLGILLIALCLPILVHAQLVNDGDTNVLDDVTNTAIGEDVTVGTNGSFTLLEVTNDSLLNSGNFNATIGLNSSAQSNHVIVSGSQWLGISTATVGSSGSGNELDILNGGIVSNEFGSIGLSASASNNVVLVSGSGSTWDDYSSFWVGNLGSFNTLIISNGGAVSCKYTYIGNGSSSLGNSLIVTGSGSLWTCGVNLWFNGPGMNQFTVNNGAICRVNYGNCSVVGNSNLLTIADPGSSLQCLTSDFTIGNGTDNQCVVSNGAQMATYETIIEGTSTRAIVTGAGSAWTNGYLGIEGYSNVLSITDGGTLFGSGAIQGSNDEVIISGPNSLWQTYNIGVSGPAQLFITNGGTLINSVASLMNDPSFFALVAGPGSLWTNYWLLQMGGSYFVTDSGKLTAPKLWFMSGSLIVSNSGFVQADILLNMGNSTTLAGGTIVTSDANVYGGGSLVINSGLMRTTNFAVASSANAIFNGGILQLGSAGWSNTNPFTVGDGSYAATLQIWNAGNCVFSNGLVISSNALLSGSGAITGNISVNNGGTIAPGTNTLATIVDNGTLTLNPGSTTLMKLNASATTSDTLIGMSNLVYGGRLQLANVSGSYSSGQSFSLFAATNYSGAFATLSPASPGPGLRWDTYELGVNGNLRVFSTPTPMPSIGSITTTSGNLLINASGGIAYDPCYLLTSTNLSAPLSNWTCITTNYFDATGATTFTNAMPADQTQQYFLLQVN